MASLPEKESASIFIFFNCEVSFFRVMPETICSPKKRKLLDMYSPNRQFFWKMQKGSCEETYWKNNWSLWFLTHTNGNRQLYLKQLSVALKLVLKNFLANFYPKWGFTPGSIFTCWWVTRFSSPSVKHVTTMSKRVPRTSENMFLSINPFRVKYTSVFELQQLFIKKHLPCITSCSCDWSFSFSRYSSWTGMSVKYLHSHYII